MLDAIVLGFSQCIKKLLKALKKKDLVAIVAVLILEMETVKIEKIKREKKGKKYWAVALVKMVILKKKSNI